MSKPFFVVMTGQITSQVILCWRLANVYYEIIWFSGAARDRLPWSYVNFMITLLSSKKSVTRLPHVYCPIIVDNTDVGIPGVLCLFLGPCYRWDDDVPPTYTTRQMLFYLPYPHTYAREEEASKMCSYDSTFTLCWTAFSSIYHVIPCIYVIYIFIDSLIYSL